MDQPPSFSVLVANNIVYSIKIGAKELYDSPKDKILTSKLRKEMAVAFTHF